LELTVSKTSNLLKEKVKHGNKKNKKKQESCIQKNRRFMPEDGMLQERFDRPDRLSIVLQILVI
jgi:hypothetical protein